MNLFIRFSISLAIGIIFFYFTIKGINLSELHFNFTYNSIIILIIFVFNFVGITFLRSLRTYSVIRNIDSIKLNEMFYFTSVGYSFIVMLPFRMGELIIPLLVKKNFGISVSTTLIIVMIERFLDLFIVLIAMFYLITYISAPKWLIHSNYFILILFTLVSLFLMFSYRYSNLIWKVLYPLIKNLSSNNHEKVIRILKGFKIGFRLIKTPRNFLTVLFLSIIILFLSVFSIQLVLSLSEINSNFTMALTILVINLIGISIPAGPAMIGNYQYSCIIALSLFEIDKNQSFIFGNLYYIMGIGMTIILGAIFYPFSQITVEDIKKSILLKKQQNMELE